MELRPGFKRTEVGVIPEDWSCPLLGELTTLMTNGFVGTATTHYVEHENGVIYVQGYNVNENSFDFHGIKYVDPTFHRLHSKSHLRAGDLLTVQTGDVGVSAVVPEALVGANCHALIISRFDQNRVYPPFISYYLNSVPGRMRLESLETGTTMKHLNVGDMLEFAVPLPMLRSEQEVICQVLAETDELIESLEQLLTKKRQIKQGAMQDLLTGTRRLSGFTECWKERALGELFEFSGGLSASRDQLSSEGYCYLHYGDIHTSQKTCIDVKKELASIPKLSIPLAKVSRASLLEDGDVVFVDASEDDEGASRHVVIFNETSIPFIAGLHTIVAKPKENALNRDYERYCFQSRDVKAQFAFFAVGTKVTGISKSNIARIKIRVPGIAEQDAIAGILDGMDADLDRISDKVGKVRRLKQGMMQELLTGRIRVV